MNGNIQAVVCGQQAICNELLDFLAKRVSAGEPLRANTDLLESELLDSLLVMDVVAHVESAYGARLENSDITPRNFRTVAAIAGLVSERRI